MIKVLLVDDHDLVRNGISHLLKDAGADAGIDAVLDTNCGEEAVRLVREEEPDIVIMDVNMPGMGGVEAMQRIRHANPTQKIVFCSGGADKTIPQHLIKSGANGYMTKGCDVQEMVQGLMRVTKGEIFISSDIQSDLIAALAAGDQSEFPLKDLSERELQILTRLAQGQRSKDMAAELFLSPKTVSTYKSRLQVKLNVNSDIELIRLAEKHGLVEEKSS